jgi:hypothetical protein
MSLKKIERKSSKNNKKKGRSSVLHIPTIYKVDLDVIEFH